MDRNELGIISSAKDRASQWQAPEQVNYPDPASRGHIPDDHQQRQLLGRRGDHISWLRVPPWQGDSQRRPTCIDVTAFADLHFRSGGRAELALPNLDLPVDTTNQTVDKRVNVGIVHHAVGNQDCRDDAANDHEQPAHGIPSGSFGAET